MSYVLENDLMDLKYLIISKLMVTFRNNNIVSNESECNPTEI